MLFQRRPTNNDNSDGPREPAGFACDSPPRTCAAIPTEARRLWKKFYSRNKALGRAENKASRSTNSDKARPPPQVAIDLPARTVDGRTVKWTSRHPSMRPQGNNVQNPSRRSGFIRRVTGPRRGPGPPPNNHQAETARSSFPVTVKAAKTSISCCENAAAGPDVTHLGRGAGTTTGALTGGRRQQTCFHWRPTQRPR